MNTDMITKRFSRLRLYNLLYIIGAYCVFKIARESGLSFIQTLMCNLLTVFITWINARLFFGRKRLSAILEPQKVDGDIAVYRFLIWNSSLFKTVFSSEFGENGLRLFVNDDAEIDDVRLVLGEQISLIKTKKDGTSNFWISDISPKMFADIEIKIRKKRSQSRFIELVNPIGTRFDNPPSLNVFYDRREIEIKFVKYKKQTQILHYSLSFASILLFITAFLGAFLFDFKSALNLILLTLACSSWFYACFSFGGIVPNFVIKYLKIRK